MLPELIDNKNKTLKGYGKHYYIDNVQRKVQEFKDDMHDLIVIILYKK